MTNRALFPIFPTTRVSERATGLSTQTKIYIDCDRTYLHRCAKFFVGLLVISFVPFAHAVDSCSVDSPILSFEDTDSASQEVTIDCSCEHTMATGVPGEVQVSFFPLLFDVTPGPVAFNPVPQKFTVVPVDPGDEILVLHWRCPENPAINYGGFGDINVLVSIGSMTPPSQPPLALGWGGANFDFSLDALDPVNTFTGELFNFYAPDINRGGPMPLIFSRYYSSSLLANNVIGDMGENWRHRFDWSVNSEGDSATVANHLGRAIEFTKTGGLWNLDGKLNIAFQLLEAGGTFTLFDPRNRRMYVFNASGRLTSIQDGKGNVHTLVYNGSNQLTQVSDGLGRTLGMTYNGTGKLSTVVGDGGQNIAFTYAGDNLSSSTDAMNNTTTYTYDAGGLMTSSTRPLGNTPYSQTWNASDQVASQTDALANTTMLDYTGTDTTITDPLSNTRVHTYSAGGEIMDNQDETGQSFGMGYDADGRRSSVTDRFGDTTSFTYDAVSGARASITNTDGTTTTNIFGTRIQNGFTLRDLSSRNYPDGSSESFIHDASGNLLSWTQRDGSQWSFTYNNRGQALNITNPLGGVSTRSYNNDGTLSSGTDAAGNTITYTYDGLRRLVMRTHPGAKTVQFSYDNNNRLLTRTDELGQLISLTYDSNNRLTGLTDPSGATIGLTPDAMDRISTVTDALGNSSSREYDPLQRLQSVTDRNGNTRSVAYDTRGRLTTLTDAMGKTWNRTFDAESILASLSDPLNNTYTFSSDNMGRITQSTTPLGHASSVTYDTMGRVVSAQNPLGETTSHTYDANGRRSSIALPGGNIAINYSRNGLGQLTDITDPDGNTWLRSYDASARESSSTDPKGNVTSFAYDSRNRPSLVTYPGGLGTLMLAYDDESHLVNRSYSDGTTLTYTYDANDRLSAASGITNSFDANGRLVANNGISANYDAGGRLVDLTLAPGKVISYAYDMNNRLVSVTDWIGGVSSFSYDAANRLVQMTRPNGITQIITYDNDNRLTGIAEGTVSSLVLNRDASGQTTSAVRNVPVSTSADGVSNVLGFYDGAAQLTNATYDAMGRLTASSGDIYVWDLASRLTMYSRGGASINVSYDASGLRTSRAEGGITRNYVWNYIYGLATVSIERQGAADVSYYVHTPSGALLYQVVATGNARHFYHYDELGNTLFVTSDAGTVLAGYAYTPYGQITASTGALDNPFTWQGQVGVMDEGNGLYYIRARYYDSANGRFISRDPIDGTGPRNVSPYQYAYGNPVRYVDVTGEDVRLAGYGRFGLDYNEAGLPDNVSETNITSRLRIQFDMSTETDSGVSFGARLRLQSEPPAGNGARFFASYGGFTVQVGNITGSLEAAPGVPVNDLFGGLSKLENIYGEAEGGLPPGFFGGVEIPGNDPDAGCGGGSVQELAYLFSALANSEAKEQSLREAYRKAVDKLEDAKLLNGLDLGGFAEDTVDEATDRVNKAGDALRAAGLDPTDVKEVKDHVQGVICLV